MWVNDDTYSSDILKKVDNQTISVPMTSNDYKWSQWNKNSLVSNILQNIFFWVQQKKEMHTDLERHEVE